MQHAACGFVMPVVLGIILIAGLLASQASSDLGTHTMLATHRLLHQRAFAVAEQGLALAAQQLRDGVLPPATQTLPAQGLPTDGATVQFTTLGERALPAGFSAGRITETCHEIRSTGHSARGAQVAVVQGACQRRSVTP